MSAAPGKTASKLCNGQGCITLWQLLTLSSWQFVHALKNVGQSAFYTESQLVLLLVIHIFTVQRDPVIWWRLRKEAPGQQLTELCILHLSVNRVNTSQTLSKRLYIFTVETPGPKTVLMPYCTLRKKTQMFCFFSVPNSRHLRYKMIKFLKEEMKYFDGLKRGFNNSWKLGSSSHGNWSKHLIPWQLVGL